MMVILSEKDIQNAKTRKFRNLVYTKYKIQEPRRKAFKMNGDFKGCVISYTFIEYENVTLEEAENLAQAEMEKDDYCYIEICGYGK